MNNNILEKENLNTENEPSPTLLKHRKQSVILAKAFSFIGFTSVTLLLIIAIIGIIINATTESIPESEYHHEASGDITSTVLFIPMIFVVMALLLFFPIKNLFIASIKLSKTINYGSLNSIESAYKNLKSQYKFRLIFSIVILSIIVMIILYFGLGILVYYYQ